VLLESVQSSLLVRTELSHLSHNDRNIITAKRGSWDPPCDSLESGWSLLSLLIGIF
jgi:hypothetical protein